MMDLPPTNVSSHLTFQELACHDTARTPYPAKFIADGRLSELALLFEEVRALLGGQPLTILSAYRTPSHNRKIGGAPNSWHMHGRALDIRPPDGMTADQMAGKLKDAWNYSQLPSLGGIGVYRAFIHIDTRRTGGRLVAWWGGAQLKDDRA
jgi:uncharacterized protein YcbK (DUF882 family)